MTRGRERRTAPILSHGQTTSGQCGFNQAASHLADPIKRHRARRERSHPKEMLTTQTSAGALDLLENQAASHLADPIKRHRARRERSHPKEMLTTQTSAGALDLLENNIDPLQTLVASDCLRSAIQRVALSPPCLLQENATELEKAGLNSYVTAAPPMRGAD
jgi:hypothetical protein